VRAAVESLKRYRVRQLEHRLATGDAYEDRCFVFANETGGHLHLNVLYRLYAALIARADVPSTQFRDLRHPSATLMLAEGVHGKIVPERLGNATIAMTIDPSSRGTAGMQRNVADVLEAAIECAARSA
jgi:integrase